METEITDQTVAMQKRADLKRRQSVDAEMTGMTKNDQMTDGKERKKNGTENLCRDRSHPSLTEETVIVIPGYKMNRTKLALQVSSRLLFYGSIAAFISEGSAEVNDSNSPVIGWWNVSLQECRA